MPHATRRSVLSGAVTGAAALGAAGYTATPAYAGKPGKPGKPGDSARLTVIGTTDLHGNVFSWDYYKNAEFSNSTGDEIGVAKVKTLIDAVREERHGEPILTIDAGDTLQGTPLAYYYARIDPITGGPTHPMANAMNLVGYDAAALGNHEFNYGIDTLRKFEEQVNFPLLGANAVDPSTKLPVFPPYIIKDYDLGRGRRLKVGVLGLTNPGIAIWDKANVEGKMEFPGLVEQAKIFVPELKKAGCDLVIISAHSGADTSSSYGDELPTENAATLVAEEVPGVDAILVGHAHREITERFVTNAETGQKVLLTEPLYWGMRVSVMDLVVRREKGHGRPRWVLESATSQTLNSNTVDPDPKVVAAVQEQHDAVIAYVNSVVGTSAVEMLAARAVVEDVPIIDFVNYVQADAVKAALTGSDADLPVISIAAPFSRAASFPAGEVTVRDVAGLYIYDNTLMAVRITGAQLKDYLEFTARYFKQVSGTGPFPIDDVTNAPTDTAPNGTPDYNYDTIGGLDAALTYDIDIAQAVGSRIMNLAYDGAAVTDEQEFVLAVNNYRQSGGGGFPHVTDAPVVYNQQVEIRQLLIDWVTANQIIDPEAFASVDWRLVSGGEPITVE
ncbi:2',3'-cyclic-nucleotide 2'-phosphodiesterase/3'-nucleotidase [Nocardioides luteus]|uniref:Multifunctional 2',3'-cyclic-nucleotide 2'-phosphodiesterase/5'-nucleotidase/3'-nucleotidase n=1 Tax=Nocardioides luteus TaxID=1844 RepID=A0ABQ5SWY3_9ACTN|nr:5'-nucleotidase C-terminal domain-containing protein [Nocardioides luteus]MDR7311738.1 2',3'-cyclic-nucleotide 2'-phosphodiesterase/3'-nucleotidase [Nocardioides luteus]GGR66290.1 multifunctional 2',3'-cyclic-nucleotide 2'-phosphodiesterase/5'-nucleotidase/3'-nucleotidase [Nocardioides luteus]GLJ67979.1 multifunctional 2',3'-cyclic-nucleotide 2'-phosphodiesterase/5'-nucleotidase/3'-nucleotidase [Nocardioides luteus]